jgi:hypothetical protein
MSPGNVELVKRLYERVAQEGLEASIDHFDPDVVWEDLDVLPGAGTYRGHAGLREAFGRFYDAWDDLSFEAEQLIDAGDAVVVAHRWRGTGKTSGTPINTLVWNVLWLRDGKVLHRRAFQSRDDALEAARLQE